jgi:hypothetical protein
VDLGGNCRIKTAGKETKFLRAGEDQLITDQNWRARETEEWEEKLKFREFLGVITRSWKS